MLNCARFVPLIAVALGATLEPRRLRRLSDGRRFVAQ